MIELQTLEATHRIGLGEIDSSEDKVEVYKGSVLAEITATLTTSAVLEEDGAGRRTLVDNEKIVDYTSQIEEHAVCLKEAKELAVRSVRQLTDIIRNTINPHIRSVVKRLEVYNADYSTSPNSLGYSIDMFQLPVRLTNPLVLNVLNVWKGKIPEGEIKGRGIGRLEPEYLISCFQGGLTEPSGTSNDNYDYLGDSSLVSKLIDFLAGNVNISTVTDYNLLALAVVVLSLTKTPPPGVTSNLADWENNRNNLMANCVTVLNKVLFMYNRNIEGQMLYVNKYDPKTKVITVFDTIYRGMLDKGLTPEAVMGNELLGRRYLSHQLLDAEVIKVCENKYKLEKSAKDTSNITLNRTNLFRNVKHALMRDLEDIADSERWPVDGDNRSKANARLIQVRDAIFKSKGIEYKSTEDIIAACLLATWYAHTDAVTLMDIASRIGSDDPELSPEEVYTLAKIEYVGLYVASQLRLVKFNKE